MTESYDYKEPKLIKSVVCFLDILGFTDIVSEACNSGQGNVMLKNLHKVLNDNIKALKPSYDGYSNLKLFTDNIVIGIPIHDDGESELGDAFIKCAFYQLNLALNGFFIRGGITIGEYYGDNNMSFGLPVVRAHELESKIANTPRIVLDEIVKKYIKEHVGYYAEPLEAPQSKEVLIDIDGFWFINYLEAVFLINDEVDLLLAKEILFKHKNIVATKIKEFQNNPKVLSKYLWVANYHNYFCNIRLKNVDDLLIDTMGYGQFKRILDTN